ncbi:MAG: N-acetyltransferase [Cytophagales bacterium]|nr:MAG: N-acetyltransferase [Cytophagales bacterium]TAF60396.1 MAG: N-acetyltransferase [Cytophagales bacterium]
MYLKIETPRLQIRPIDISDADFMLELLNSEGWLKFIGNRNIKRKVEAEEYIQNILDKPSSYCHIFELKSIPKAIGIITFLQRDTQQYPDLGFAMLPEYEGKGYALEANKAYLSEIIKSQLYSKIIAIAIKENSQSIKLIEKLGMRYETDCQESDTVKLALYGLSAKAE